MSDQQQYLHLIVRSLIDQYGFADQDAVRAARGFVLDVGDDLPAGDAAELIRQGRWAVADRRTQFGTK